MLQIEAVLKELKHGHGWHHVLYDLSLKLEGYFVAQPLLEIDVVQVKAKAGSLRFHLD